MTEYLTPVFAIAWFLLAKPIARSRQRMLSQTDEQMRESVLVIRGISGLLLVLWLAYMLVR